MLQPMPDLNFWQATHINLFDASIIGSTYLSLSSNSIIGSQSRLFYIAVGITARTYAWYIWVLHPKLKHFVFILR